MNVSPVLPMPDASHCRSTVIRPVDLRDRELQRQHAFHAALRPDRRHQPRGGLVGGLVVAEVGDADVVDGVGVQRLLVGVAQFTALVGTGEDVGAEVDALVGGVDDIAAGVEQQARPRTRSACTISRKKSLNRALAADQALPSRASSNLIALSQSVNGAV